MLLTAERIVVGDRPRSGMGMHIGSNGGFGVVAPLQDMGVPDVNLGHRVIVPGSVNAHSQSFQRLLRGYTQIAGDTADNFPAWRKIMHRVASMLDPESLYIVARQAFIEMLLNGVTSVGEFHYVHHQPDGTPYDDVSAMGEALLRAALDTGIRLCLIRVVYLRGGYDNADDPLQCRFIDPNVDVAIERIESLYNCLAEYKEPRLSLGIAAHSLCDVPWESVCSLRTYLGHIPFHIKVGAQRFDVEECRRRYGLGPVALLDQRGLLDGLTTLVHANHLEEAEVAMIARHGALVCASPGAAADLGGGWLDLSQIHDAGVRLCVGTHGQMSSSVMREAGRLELNERMRSERRNILVGEPHHHPGGWLLDAVTTSGACALGLAVGSLEQDTWADWVSYDLDDPTLIGADDHALLAALFFSADSRAVRDVMVGGKWVVENGVHPLTVESTQAYRRLAKRLFR